MEGRGGGDKSLQLTEVEVTFVAFDLIHGAAVEQLEAVEGAVLQPARANPPLQQLRARDAGAGAGRQGGRLGSLLEASHARGGSTNRIAAEKLFSPVKEPHGRLHLWTDCVSKALSQERPRGCCCCCCGPLSQSHGQWSAPI